MPAFEIETPGGRFEIKAADQARAVATLRRYEPSLFERVGNATYDALNALGLPGSRTRRDLINLDNAVRGAADTLTFGASDEIAARAGALFGKNYETELERQRAIDRTGGRARLVGQIAGGVLGGTGIARTGLSLTANAATTGKGFLPTLGYSAVEGGAAGAAYGYGSGEGGIAKRAREAVRDAPSGAALGLGAGAVGHRVGRTARAKGETGRGPLGGAFRREKSPSELAGDTSPEHAAIRSMDPDAVDPLDVNGRYIRHVSDFSNFNSSFDQAGYLQHLEAHIDDLAHLVAGSKGNGKSSIYYDVLSPSEAMQLSPDLRPYLAQRPYRRVVRSIPEDAIRHILTDHGGDQLPMTADHIKLIPRVLRLGELVGVGKHQKGEAVFIRRMKIGENWLYVVEALRGSSTEWKLRKLTLQLKTAYWSSAK